jgi:hypothetical protein
MAAQIVSQIGNIVNTTLQASTYTDSSSFSSALKSNSMPNDLYAGHDFNALSYPEQLWARWVSRLALAAKKSAPSSVSR